MSSNITLGRVVEYTRRFINRAPLIFPGSNNIDPAASFGDWVRGFILSPPFAWRWNRGGATVTCVAGTQDYSINAPNFGWLEHASITDPTDTQNDPSPLPNYTLNIVLDAFESSVVQQPTQVCAQGEDNNGNISIRLFPVPDKPYILNLTWQNAAPVFKTINDSWAPIPDYLYYLVQTGYLAKAYEYMGDERFAATIQLFARQLAALNGGLNDSQVDVVLLDQITSQRTLQADLQSTQQARQARNL